MRRRDELLVLQSQLEDLAYHVRRAKRDLDDAEKAINYILDRLQKLINGYSRPQRAETGSNVTI